MNAPAIGPSSVRWTGESLEIEIDEWTAPLPSRVRGKVTLKPQAIAERAYGLDAAGRHHWRPIAPRARIDVRFDDGALAWKGDAYLDSNWGSEPLERAFTTWDWSRAHTKDGTVVHYDVTHRAGTTRGLSLCFDAEGRPTAITPPPLVRLPDTFWKVARNARGAADAPPRLVRTLEDSPFYARSSLTAEIDGAPADIMHESLSLDRFRSSVVRSRALVPADGYYEWLTVGKTKTPYFVTDPEEGELAFAGLYSWWRPPAAAGSDGSEGVEPEPWVLTATILTRAAAGPAARIHDRIPVMLPRSEWDAWLDPTIAGDHALVQHAVAASQPVIERLAVHEVAPLRGDGPELIAPLNPL